MKTTFPKSLRFLFVIGATLCAVPPSSLADEARFFRIAGPVPTTITAVGADGYVTWTSYLVPSALITVTRGRATLSAAVFDAIAPVHVTFSIAQNRKADQ